MTRGLWIDAGYGAAGDMLLAALLDAGGSAEAVRAALDALGRAGAEPITVRIESCRRHGLRASRAIVECARGETNRGLDEVLALLAGAELAPPASRFAEAVFGAIAHAEARVHGIEVDQVHFHEVGALDALADVVGCAVALDSLGLLDPATARTVTPVALGSGRVLTSHGELPVPVPATLELLSRAGAPVLAGPSARELCTPTGAALLATLATGWGTLPAMTISATGIGAGAADPAEHPNLLRVVLGELAPGRDGWQERELTCLESTVDDLDPRLWPGALDALHEAGALDAWLTPVLMRHGRPGHVVTAIVPAAMIDAVFDRLVRDTTTLGARLSSVTRRSLVRDVVTVEVAGHPVAVKRGLSGGTAVTVQPEFADAVAAARASGLTVAEVLQAARAAGTS